MEARVKKGSVFKLLPINLASNNSRVNTVNKYAVSKTAAAKKEPWNNFTSPHGINIIPLPKIGNASKMEINRPITIQYGLRMSRKAIVQIAQLQPIMMS